jgi:hypothetical protein
VANKLGGVHFDRKRDGAAGERLALLDRRLATYAPDGASQAIFGYVELLSIAEAVAESSDVARFRHAFAKAERRAAAESESSTEEA